MFSLPQGARQGEDAELIAVSESSQVLGHLLSMVSGISLPPLDDIDVIEPLLYAAEKYEMVMAIAILRFALNHLLPTAPPIKIYGIACQLSWEDEAKATASRTVEMDILSEENATALNRLETTHLTKLLLLHERRRKMVIVALADPGLFNVGNVMGRRCMGDDGSCGELEDHSTWWAFKLAWITEPWRFHCLARQHTVPGAMSLPLELECLHDECGKCGKSLYSRDSTLTSLQAIARSLPQTIEWS